MKPYIGPHQGGVLAYFSHAVFRELVIKQKLQRKPFLEHRKKKWLTQANSTHLWLWPTAWLHPHYLYGACSAIATHTCHIHVDILLPHQLKFVRTSASISPIIYTYNLTTTLVFFYDKLKILHLWCLLCKNEFIPNTSLPTLHKVWPFSCYKSNNFVFFLFFFFFSSFLSLSFFSALAHRVHMQHWCQPLLIWMPLPPSLPLSLSRWLVRRGGHADTSQTPDFTSLTREHGQWRKQHHLMPSEATSLPHPLTQAHTYTQTNTHTHTTLDSWNFSWNFRQVRIGLFATGNIIRGWKLLIRNYQPCISWTILTLPPDMSIIANHHLTSAKHDYVPSLRFNIFICGVYVAASINFQYQLDSTGGWTHLVYPTWKFLFHVCTKWQLLLHWTLHRATHGEGELTSRVCYILTNLLKAFSRRRRREEKEG